MSGKFCSSRSASGSGRNANKGSALLAAWCCQGGPSMGDSSTLAGCAPQAARGTWRCRSKSCRATDQKRRPETVFRQSDRSFFNLFQRFLSWFHGLPQPQTALRRMSLELFRLSHSPAEREGSQRACADEFGGRPTWDTELARTWKLRNLDEAKKYGKRAEPTWQINLEGLFLNCCRCCFKGLKIRLNCPPMSLSRGSRTCKSR